MKLHIGSGAHRFPGWTNVDIREDVNPDIISSVDQLEEVPPRSASHLYASHVLEHFRHARTIDVLKVWHSRLKPGGKCWISVPDMDIIAELHCKHKNKLGPPQFPWNALIYGGQEYPENTHYACFNFKYIRWCLVRAGFKNVRQVSIEEHCKNLPGVKDYSICKYVGEYISLNVEAIA